MAKLSTKASLLQQLIPQAFSLSMAGIRLELLTPAHTDDLAIACQDGQLWELIYTSTPTIDGVADYIRTAEVMLARLEFVVIDERLG